MESIKPLLEAVPSELIVVDTVGPEKSDGSLDVVREYTDKIYHFDWINDFSAARNVAIDHAKGEWFLYFDDDEYFDDVTEFIEFFKSGESEQYYSGIYYTGDYTSEDVFQKDIAGRMIRRTEETRFVGYVHEQFNVSYSPVKLFNVFTHHFGYLYESEEQKQAKMDRNMVLLEKDLKENGYNAKVCGQIVAQLIGEDPAEAYKRCVEYVNELEKRKDLGSSCGQWLITASIRLLANYGNLEGILDIEKNYLSKNLMNETSRLIFHLQIASVAYCHGDYKIASERIREYFELLDWLNEHEQTKILQMQFDSPTFIMDYNLFTMTKIGVITEGKLRNYEAAYNYIKRLDYNYCKDFKEIKKVIEITLKELNNPTPAVEYYKKFYKDEFFEEPKLRKYLPELISSRL
jgi:glycosyltransferase involved in cell wall biosynthesis